MPLSELSERSAVLQAIEEYDRLGETEFLARHAFGPAKRLALKYQGRSYPSKAIAGVAFGYQFPERPPLSANDFSGGVATVVPLLQSLGFEVVNERSVHDITSGDIAQIRSSRTKDRWDQLTSEELTAYRHVHDALQFLGSQVVGMLNEAGSFAVKLTSGFSPNSGVRGYLPKDLWLGVYNTRNDAFVGMPQLFVIVSERGIELGFAACIHPQDFSQAEIKQRVKQAASRIFRALPEPGSVTALELSSALATTAPWYFRRKTRLAPNNSDFEGLDSWLAFLKSAEGVKWAGGSISRYLSETDLDDPELSLPDLIHTATDIFADTMVATTPTDRGSPIQAGLEWFLRRFPEIRSSSPFGGHEELKIGLNEIRDEIQSTSAVSAHPDVRVSWSVGQGSWARIPWIALMDERVTTTTQEGLYCVFLFPEDMSGVYLTLNQGVTSVFNELGRAEGREALRARADTVRAALSQAFPSLFPPEPITLSSEGSLGQAYEASTIGHKFYKRGSVPDDRVIDQNVAEFLRAYQSALAIPLGKARTERQWWIFQANPENFDVDGALAGLSEVTWIVGADSEKPAVGDGVFIWRQGSTPAVIALATVISGAEVRELPQIEIPYATNHDANFGSLPRLTLHIDEVIQQPVYRTDVAGEPRLRDLEVFKFERDSIFKLATHHSAALLEVINDTQTPLQRPASTQRIWIYSPGEEAEFWDEFYEKSVMAIGWDRLGDLGQYGSVDDFAAALVSAYELDHRPINNARACFDFVQTMSPGDRVFAKRGRSSIVGYGTVIGNYEHDPARPRYRNFRKVLWEQRGTWPASYPLPVKTLTEVSDEKLIETLRQIESGGGLDVQAPLPEPLEVYTLENAQDGLFMSDATFRATLETWKRKKNLILQGPPGVGKSFVAKRLSYALMGYRDPSRVRTVQFHQSFSYEDFIQGYRPAGNGLSLQQGVFVEFCDKARKDSEHTYVFIIDEINRGNLSKIFGELMLLIEADKRSSEWATKLAYAPDPEERFYVPANVFILGMMNTADRSLSLVDYALRRRFAFVTLAPAFESEGFSKTLSHRGVPDALVQRIIDHMTDLNADIGSDKANLGTGFCVGHSFFVPAANDSDTDTEWYRRVIAGEIVPLLEEYWFDNPDKVAEWQQRLLSE